MALAQHEFELDMIALTGGLRHSEHRSVPEVHQALRAREVEITEWSVSNLPDRYDELLATTLGNALWLRELLAKRGQTILAIDGL